MNQMLVILVLSVIQVLQNRSLLVCVVVVVALLETGRAVQ